MAGVVYLMIFILGAVSARSTREYVFTGEPEAIKSKDSINQWNIVQVGSQTDNNEREKGPIAPGFVWVQVPVSNLAIFGNTQISQSQNENINNVENSSVLGNQTNVPGGTNQPDKNGVHVSSPVTEPSSGGNLDKLCLKPSGQFPSKSCNKFVNCWNGVAIEQECSKGLLFNPKGFCDFPEKVNCNGKPIEEPLAPPVSETSAVTPLWTSPSPISQDQTSNSTLSPEVTSPTVATLPSVDPALKKLCLKPRGQFPGTSCGKFVNCWDDVVVEQECPEGLLFSSKGYCDYAQNVDCSEKATNKLAIHEFLECPEEFGTFRDKYDCGSYYTCVSYKTVARFVCPDGFKFSKKLGICDYQDKVDCSEETENTLKSNFISSKHVQENGQCPVKYGTFRDINNCSRYYSCASFKIVAQHDCPPGYSFNDEIGNCDYSEKVDCMKNPKIYQITSNSILQLPQEYRERVNSCKPGSVFRLNSQCTTACLCRQGLAEIVQCPTGFAYDSATDKCLLAHMARC